MSDEPSGPACRKCQRLLTRGARLVVPYPTPSGLPQCAAAAAYTGPVRRLVIAYKERGRRELAGIFAEALIQTLVALPEVRRAICSPRGRVLLVPVPASRAAFRARGVDHVEAIVKNLVRRLHPQSRTQMLGQMQWVQLLEPTRRVADQGGLNAAARKANLAGSLRIRAGGGRYWRDSGPVVVIVDDVLTTGATVAEAARALRAGGVRPAACAVIAAVVRSDSLPKPPLSTGRHTS